MHWLVKQDLRGVSCPSAIFLYCNGYFSKGIENAGANACVWLLCITALPCSGPQILGMGRTLLPLCSCCLWWPLWSSRWEMNLGVYREKNLYRVAFWTHWKESRGGKINRPHSAQAQTQRAGRSKAFDEGEQRCHSDLLGRNTGTVTAGLQPRTQQMRRLGQKKNPLQHFTAREMKSKCTWNAVSVMQC